MKAGEWEGIEKVFSEFSKDVPIVSCSDNGLESLLGNGPPPGGLKTSSHLWNWNQYEFWDSSGSG